MNLRFLKTVIAIAQHRSLVDAAKSVNLSHSAVSLQVSSLENELEIQILDRTRRPPILTNQGWALVEHAKRMELVVDDIWSLSDRKDLHGKVSIGAVPSAISHMVAPALAALRTDHPLLDVELQTGLSNQLIQRVMDRDIVTALVTEPDDNIEELSIFPICREPFELVVPKGEVSESQFSLLRNRPFVWFERRSLLSQQVARFLDASDVSVQTSMEASSIEAVEALVAHGLGVSILPRRTRSPRSNGVDYLPLGDKQFSRHVALVTRARSPRLEVTNKFATALKDLACLEGESVN